MNVAKLIRQLLARAGISQGELSRRLGTAREQVSRWCNGHAVPTGEMLLRIVDVTGHMVKPK